MILPKIIAIVGPTASGKTSLAIEIAERFGGEIVSADSRQIYRGMDIGTAKATAAERARIPHHLIDVKDPDQEYTAADFQRDAIAAIREILSRRRLPIIAGGTGLYIRAVLENMDIPKIKADPALRAEIEREVEAVGLQAVFKKLVALDPEAEYVVDPKNPRRVVRALEVAIATGEPFTAQRKKSEPLFDPLEIGLMIPWEKLKERIGLRIDEMARNGLAEEVHALVEKYGPAAAALDAIGYREIVDYVNGACTLDEAVAAIKMNTIHYAKRQLTWFKKDKNIRWVADRQEAEHLVEKFLNGTS